MSSDLCSGCGMCCDGTLYGRLEVDAGEAARLQRLRLPLLRVDDGLLQQPCAAHGRDRCSIYADRPGKCADYQCALYRRVGAGEMRYTEAVAAVGAARQLAKELRALLPDADRAAPLFDNLRSVLEGRIEDPRGRRENAELLMVAATLAAVCQRDFDPRIGRPRQQPPSRSAP